MLFPIAYAPSISYLRALVHAEQPTWDIHEHWIKQTIRNRAEINASEGKLALVIPIKHSKEKQTIGEITIDDKQPWRRNHWRSLKTCYQNAPYFQDYTHELSEIYQQSDQTLLEFNRAILTHFINAWELPISMGYSQKFTPYTAEDFRKKDWLSENEILPKYYQVFQLQKPFVSNLSCLDLLFNEGPLGRNWILEEE